MTSLVLKDVHFRFPGIRLQRSTLSKFIYLMKILCSEFSTASQMSIHVLILVLS